MNEASRLGSYELIAELARGGMGTVHLARKLGAARFERLAVIKRIHAHLATEPEFRAMFVEEARLSALVRHPNVVAAFDVVEEAGVLALVLEYVESVPLSLLCRAARQEGRALDLDVASRIVCDALAGLHAAHEARDLAGRPLGIVHRDVSPQNILVGSDGASRLIDFGIAKAAERTLLTETGVLKGKLRYMSPEQARHKPLDRRSDIFASGAVLYEVLCDRSAFGRGTEASTLLDLLLGQFPPPTRPDGSALPELVVELLARALAIEPSERFASALELRDALAAAIPPANEGAVGALVERVGGALLAERRGWIAACASGLAKTTAEMTPPAVEAPTETALSSPVPSAAGHRTRYVALAAGAALLLLGGTIAVAGRRGAAGLPAAAPPSLASLSPSASPLDEAPPSDGLVEDAGGRVPAARTPGKGRRPASSPSGAPSAARQVLHGNPYR